jgi:hypothetical protein
MRRFAVVALATVVGFGAMWVAQEVKPAAASDGEQAVLRIDHSLAGAIGKKDRTAVDKFLDANFEWTDADGKTRTKAEALENLTALAAAYEGDTDLKTHFYAKLDILFGFHHNARFGRIWVKRPAGWRALVFLDTSLPKQTPASAPASANTPSGGDCDNPCRTLPYTPTTAADKAVLAEWQKTKVDEWRPDAADWATHVAEEFLIINDRSERNKPQRVAFGKSQQEAGISMPGDPIESMTMSDFGDSVVMISHHVPYRGGKPYYNVRVFVHRDAHWLIAWSQQTTIQAAPSVPAVAAKQ